MTAEEWKKRVMDQFQLNDGFVRTDETLAWIQEAIAAERERCARICDEYAVNGQGHYMATSTAVYLANKIREARA